MEKLLKLVFWVCLPLTAVAWWKRDNFVPHQFAPPAISAEPSQAKIEQGDFRVAFNDVDYQVLPKYDYDLTGMVVSYRYHDGDRLLHKLWNDHLNVADICVVWGDNLQATDLNAIDFYNGQFTCNFSTGDREVWRRFNPDQLSNNHLVTDDPALRERITDLRIGDIVRVRGWLSWYGLAERERRQLRRTSVVRTDSGDGACETIYVRDFEVISSMPNQWRSIFIMAGATLLLVSALWVWAVGTGRFVHRVR